jgi:hypothetical protein
MSEERKEQGVFSIRPVMRMAERGNVNHTAEYFVYEGPLLPKLAPKKRHPFRKRSRRQDEWTRPTIQRSPIAVY